MRAIKELWRLFPVAPEGVWRPSADVYRTPAGWLLKFDLAGVKLEDFSISVEGRRVSVAGFRRDLIVDEGSSHYSMEISYNRFERVIEMPCRLDDARVTIEARDGIVLVRMLTEGNEHA